MRAPLAPAAADANAPVLGSAGVRGPLHELLDALATEVGELDRCANALQGLFGRLMAGPSAASPEALEQAQALDGLAQRLSGLDRFLTELSARPLDDLETDAATAAAGLPLTRQARRLGLAAPRLRETPDGGDCDLF